MSIVFLGHVVSSEYILVDFLKIEAIGLDLHPNESLGVP